MQIAWNAHGTVNATIVHGCHGAIYFHAWLYAKLSQIQNFFKFFSARFARRLLVTPTLFYF